MCELCGFEPKTKNKSRERMNHLTRKHFQEQMNNKLNSDNPKKCPRCDMRDFKDTSSLHMISKHNVLDQHLVDAIQKIREMGKQPFGVAAVLPTSRCVLKLERLSEKRIMKFGVNIVKKGKTT